MYFKILICNLTNVAITGLGTLLAGRIAPGIIQLVLHTIIVLLGLISFGFLAPLLAPIYIGNLIWSFVSVHRATRRNASARKRLKH